MKPSVSPTDWMRDVKKQKEREVLRSEQLKASNANH